jgi:hypothetical protein
VLSCFAKQPVLSTLAGLVTGNLLCKHCQMRHILVLQNLFQHCRPKTLAGYRNSNLHHQNTQESRLHGISRQDRAGVRCTSHCVSTWCLAEPGGECIPTLNSAARKNRLTRLSLKPHMPYLAFICPERHLQLWSPRMSAASYKSQDAHRQERQAGSNSPEQMTPRH